MGQNIMYIQYINMYIIMGECRERSAAYSGGEKYSEICVRIVYPICWKLLCPIVYNDNLQSNHVALFLFISAHTCIITIFIYIF